MKPPLKQQLSKTKVAAGFADCLSYMLLLDEQTILHKDFFISRHFQYYPPDLTVASDVECAAIANSWQLALKFLSDGWLLETNFLSQKAQIIREDIKCYQEPLAMLIAKERACQYQVGNYLQSNYYLSLTWKPSIINKQAAKLFNFNENDFIAANNQLNHDKRLIQQLLQSFNAVVDDVVGVLSRSMQISALQSNALMTFLHQCITGNDTTITAPKLGCFLDAYLVNDDFKAGFNPKIGENYLSALALSRLPNYSMPNILGALTQYPGTYRWSSRFAPMSVFSTEKVLKRYARHWSSKAIGLLGVLRESLGLPSKRDEDAQATTDRIEAAIVDNRAGNIIHGFYNSTIILANQDLNLLKQQIQIFKTLVQQLNFQARVETINACEAYLGSLPGHANYNLRKLLVDSNYLAHALPSSGLVQNFSQGAIAVAANDAIRGEDEQRSIANQVFTKKSCNDIVHTLLNRSPCNLAGYHSAPHLLTTTTYGNRPFFLNLHISDVGHTAILGPTGSGKSTLLGMLMLAHRKYKNSRIIVLDQDQSHKKLIQALGGNYTQLAGNQVSLAPLANLNDDVAFELASQWLIDVMRNQGVEITPQRQRCLQEALVRLAQEPACYQNLNYLVLQESALREALLAFNQGLVNQCLNGKQNPLQQQSIVGFELGLLLPSSGALSASTTSILQALFLHIQQAVIDKRPTLLILEEAWRYLKHPLFLEKLQDWFKTLRKYNVAVILASQDLSDIATSKAQAAIQSACMTRIYLPNAAAIEAQISRHYQAFGLNKQQIQHLATAIPKQDYFWQAAQSWQQFQLDLGEVAQTVLCGNSLLSIQPGASKPTAINALNLWLKQQGLLHWADWLQQQSVSI